MMGLDLLEIKLLGGFAVTLNHQPITAFRSAKNRALLAFLATQPDRRHARTMLAAFLWGDLPEQSAQTNLRVELSNLKKLLSAHPALEISRNDVCFHSALAATDVYEFSRTVERFFALPVESQAAHMAELARAAERYQGEYLAGINLYAAAEFDDWRLSTGEQLHDQMMLALATLQMRYAEQARWPEVVGAARRQIALVPWTESAHRNLMVALAAQGQTQAALEQYAKCCKILAEELGVGPSLPTLELAGRLRHGRAAAPTAQHNLTRQHKSLVGRKAEIAQLQALLRRERLVTILGIGGVGKSHLAQVVAQSLLHDFADGVWFLPLANFASSDATPEAIALAIAGTIGCPIANGQTPLSELARYLAHKQMLLVLDNLEHLRAAAEALIFSLLDNTAVHILATSRVRLTLEGDNPIPLGGLAADEAFTLFVERARRIVPSFASVEKAAIAQDVHSICAQVAGLPLGIELAASWVEHYSVVEIGHSLAEIAIEPRQADDLVSRHHQLHGVFAYSWQLLSTREQQVLARLSVFRGGFDRTAAAAVAASGLSELSVLLGHSLVQRVAAGRYDLHPLIQEFAGAKLSDEERATLHATHSLHYLCTLMATERTRWPTQLRIDFENLRSAWQRAVDAGDDALVQQAAPYFSDFIAQFGLMSDGDALFQRAIERFSGASQSNELAAQLLYQQWGFARTAYGLRAASSRLHHILSLTNSQELLVKTHMGLAIGYAEDGAWEQTDEHFDRAEELTRQAADLGSYIRAVEGRIHIDATHFRGDFAQGIARLEEMLALLDSATTPAADEEALRYQLLTSLAVLANRHGDYAAAIRHGRENLMRTTDLGHQQQHVDILLNLALAEQFAGLYAEAIAHNQEALALSEAIWRRRCVRAAESKPVSDPAPEWRVGPGIGLRAGKRRGTGRIGHRPARGTSAQSRRSHLAGAGPLRRRLCRLWRGAGPMGASAASQPL